MVTVHPFDQGPSMVARQPRETGGVPQEHEVASPTKAHHGAQQQNQNWPLAGPRNSTGGSATGLPGIGHDDGTRFYRLSGFYMTETGLGLLQPAGRVSANTSFDSSGGIPGLGGIDADATSSGLFQNGVSTFPVTQPPGGRKPLLKQPPPKRAQRQFERVWNVAGGMTGYVPESEDSPALADKDFRWVFGVFSVI